MATLPEEEISRTIAAMGKHKRPDGTHNVYAIARELGLSHSTIQNRVARISSGYYGTRSGPSCAPNDKLKEIYRHGRELRDRGTDSQEARYSEPFPLPQKTAKEERQDVRSLDFWRSKAKRLEAELAEAESLIGQVTGLMDRQVTPPPFITPMRSSDKHRVAGLLHISDVHAGEVVVADEVAGINAYDLEICRKRLRRLFHAAVEILPRWSSDSELTGVVVALNGDLVSGSIHDELRETNALTSHEQTWFIADELASGIRHIADQLSVPVFVPVTGGNHGRSTEKPRFKQAAKLSYDVMVGEALRRHFDGDPRITVQIWPGRDAVYQILGNSIFQSHGDGTLRGGFGFLGPGGPILRGSKQIELQAAQMKTEYDVILLGHLHHSMNPGKVFANGSVIGMNEYAHGLRFSPEPPKQWLALVHSKWGVRERIDVQLEEPRRPAKPRIRVPARMT